MDEELLRHLRQLTDELRRFIPANGDRFERLIDNFDTILDGARARARADSETPTSPIAESFLSQIPEWLIVYDRNADDRVVWFNREFQALVGISLDDATQKNLTRENLFDFSRCLFNLAGFDHYTLANEREAMGRAGPFTFYCSGVQYAADLTFNFDHYAISLTEQEYALLENSPTGSTPGLKDEFLGEVLENIPQVIAIKDLNGAVEWCNSGFFRLVRKLSPRGNQYARRDELYGKTSPQLFQLESAQAHRLTRFEDMVAQLRQPLVAFDLIHQETKRLTLRFPIDDPATNRRYIGVISMPL